MKPLVSLTGAHLLGHWRDFNIIPYKISRNIENSLDFRLASSPTSPIWESTSRALRASLLMMCRRARGGNDLFTVLGTYNFRFEKQGSRLQLAVHTLAEIYENEMVFKAYAREMVHRHRVFKMDPALWIVSILFSLWYVISKNSSIDKNFCFVADQIAWKHRQSLENAGNWEECMRIKRIFCKESRAMSKTLENDLIIRNVFTLTISMILTEFISNHFTAKLSIENV